MDVGPRDDWNASLDGINLMRLPVVPIPSRAPLWQRGLLSLHWRLRRTPLKPLTEFIADLFLPLNRGARLDLVPEAVEAELGRHDVVIATGPGWSMIEFGAQVSRAWGCTFLADYRDPWSIELPEVALHMMANYGKMPFAWFRKRRMRRLEQRYAGNAHGITAATPTVLENALRVIGDRPSAVVYNGHEAQQNATRPTPTDRFTIVYTGSIYWDQEWEIVNEALTSLGKQHPDAYRHLNILLIGASSSHHPTMTRVQRLIDAHRCITAIPRMDRSSTIRAQNTAERLLHVGFKGKRGILPLKFLEYIHAGVPVIQVSSGKDIQEDILERTRTGTVAPDAATLMDLLLEGVSNWRSGIRAPHHPDQQALAEFTWDHQMERWRQFILAMDHGRTAGVEKST